MINKISFKGIVVRNKMTTDNVKELAKFTTANTKLINKLEKTYGTDVYVNTDKRTASLVHKTYGKDIQRYGNVENVPFDKFDNNIIDELEIAIMEEEKEFERMNDCALFHMYRI